jgi:hypothetical protein
MKPPLSCLLATLLLLSSPGCIFVHVTGEPGDFLDDDDEDEAGFRELSAALEGCLTDPDYDLDLVVSPWRTEATWTVRYCSEGSDGHAAFHRAREAVLARIEREGGRVTGQQEDGPMAWSCSFRKDGDPGEASVRLVENEDEDDERPNLLEVDWEETD